MLLARRLDSGSRLALQSALAVHQRQPASALVFSSRHGEIGHTLRILQTLAARQPVSPADFAASVHNTAAGQFTITAGQPLPASSVSAGKQTFLQALFEVRAFFAAGHLRVLHVDFENSLPAVFHSAEVPATIPRAAAFLWENTPDKSAREISSAAISFEENSGLPPAFAFLQRHFAGTAPQPCLS